jgi:Holliday junction resolvasome RuvABC ATP-dependent DNA helicase subunit
VTREQLIAQALVAWLDEALQTERDVAREGLPDMDVGWFLARLAQLPSFPVEQVSLALVGFGVRETDLRALADKRGLRELRHLATDLNTAAAWRNEHKQHPRIIALARGRHPGVHTLRHFAPARSRDLARALLLHAADDKTFTNGYALLHDLLERLANSPELESLRSLESIADFLAEWSKHARTKPDEAPLLALPQLGLLADDELFGAGTALELRLARNLEVTHQLLQLPRNQFGELRERLKKMRNRKQRETLLDMLDCAETLQRQPSAHTRATLTLDKAQTLFRPPKDTPSPADTEPETENEDDYGELNVKKLARETVDALLENRQEELEAAAEAMEVALLEAIAEDKEQLHGQVEFGGETRSFSIKRNRSLDDWLHKFCSEDAWGGVLESTEPSLELALASHEASTHRILSADDVAKPEEREQLSMAELLAAWDEDLAGEVPNLALAKQWEQFVALRAELVQHLDALVHLPPLWLAGKPALAGRLTEYLKLAGEIYGAMQRHFRQMADVSPSWARAAIEAALALDVLQVRVDLGDGREAHKAILLPTHPLHLWRRQRFSAILRGLGEHLDARDREAIRRESDRPEHFLSVISIGSIPAGRGVNQILPVANDLHGMATFENLINAYSGPDGAETLAYAINRFAVLGRHHARPLRVVVVNPPDAPKLLAHIVKVLKQRRAETLPCLSLELFATPDHVARIQAALRFSGEERELLEEQISAGRLRFRAHEKPRKLPHLIAELKAHPCHLLAIFDEATIRIRRRGAGRHLPMSPFCVRHEITFDKRDNAIRLEPTSDEPPFSEFMQLINEAESGQRDSSPHAWADAEILRQVLDDVLQSDEPAAHWAFLADRALPAESGMKSVRLLHKRDGQRQVLVAAANHERMARLVRPVFDKSGLSLSPGDLSRLLEEGVNLVGAGLLDLIRENGQPDPNRVRGLAGMLVAARDYRLRHSDSLLVAVDNEVARLWLRLGREGDRCDLLAMRRDGAAFVLEAIEVKTTERGDGAATREPLRKAQEQVTAVLNAMSIAVPDNTTGDNPLSAPRCEMLKEVLVRGCQSRAVQPAQRGEWSAWLKQLFRQEEGEPPKVRCQGEVICVLLGVTEPTRDESLTSSPFPISARMLGAERIEELISAGGSTYGEPGDESRDSGITSHRQSTPLKPKSKAPSSSAKAQPKSPEQTIDLNKRAVPPLPIKAAAPDEQNDTAVAPLLPWPPPVNALGMIGQTEAVGELVRQMNYARARKRRFSDKLLVGPAGVGKSSLARAIARKLLNDEEVLFNGADLKSPAAIIMRLRERNKLPARLKGEVKVLPCLVFIDEVHAISNAVHTTLLSAMDDERTAPIDGVVYDFGDVVFILATTDPGRLSEAFNSRPDKTYLRSYTLEEVAGIIWLHGKVKENLNGYELPRDVCLEIAARMRCNPRRAVRCLTERLLPYFHSQTHRDDEKLDVKRLARAIEHKAVCHYFDEQNIDLNGLDVVAKNYMNYLARNGATPEERLRQGLGITNRGDFVEVDEFLSQRLGLVTISSAGRTLSPEGRRYLTAPFDLRERISRQR